MIYRGICWGIIISIPFWLLAIWLIKSGVIALKTLIIIGVILSAPYVFLIMRSRRKTEQDHQSPELIAGDVNEDPTTPVRSTNHHRNRPETETPD